MIVILIVGFCFHQDDGDSWWVFWSTLYNGTYILKERKSTWEQAESQSTLGNVVATSRVHCARVRPHCCLLRVSSLLANFECGFRLQIIYDRTNEWYNHGSMVPCICEELLGLLGNENRHKTCIKDWLSRAAPEESAARHSDNKCLDWQGAFYVKPFHRKLQEHCSAHFISILRARLQSIFPVGEMWDSSDLLKTIQLKSRRQC